MVTMKQAEIIAEQARDFILSEKPTLSKLVDDYLLDHLTATFFMFAYLRAWNTKGIENGALDSESAITIFGCCDDFDYLGSDDDPLSINEVEFRKRIELCSEGKWQEVRKMM